VAKLNAKRVDREYYSLPFNEMKRDAVRLICRVMLTGSRMSMPISIKCRFRWEYWLWTKRI